MKTLIFSDTHLTTKFNPRTYKLLSSLIMDADAVVINGDLWEGWRISFDEFLTSPWSKLFPLLREKSAVYIYGNHDSRQLADERVTLFSAEQVDRYVIQENGLTFIIEHGDRFSMPYKKFAYSKFGRAVARNQITMSVSASLELALVKMRMLKAVYTALGLNYAIKKRIVSQLKLGDIYICGHTHHPEFDNLNGFINSGFIRHGLAHFVVIEDGSVSLKKASYGRKLTRRQKMMPVGTGL